MNTAGLILRFLSIVSISKKLMSILFSKALYGAKQQLDTKLPWIQSWHKAIPKENKRESGAFYHCVFCAFVKKIQSNKRMIPLSLEIVGIAAWFPRGFLGKLLVFGE